VDGGLKPLGAVRYVPRRRRQNCGDRDRDKASSDSVLRKLALR